MCILFAFMYCLVYYILSLSNSEEEELIMSKQVKMIKTKLVNIYKEIRKPRNLNSEMTLLASISQLHH